MSCFKALNYFSAQRVDFAPIPFDFKERLDDSPILMHAPPAILVAATRAGTFTDQVADTNPFLTATTSTILSMVICTTPTAITATIMVQSNCCNDFHGLHLHGLPWVGAFQ
jgi:hypothetical protein